MKMDERPDKAISQEKTSACFAEAARKPSKPNNEATRIPTKGLPRRSMYPNTEGMKPWFAKVANVLDVAKTDEFATESTAIKMTAFMITERP